MEETKLNFYEKVTKVQTELKAPKGQYNKFGNYNYRSCEDIVESIKPLLAKYGLYLNISDEIILVGDRYYVRATAMLTDGSAATTTTGFAREPNDKKGMDESQITGAASSYARKYALNGLLAIDDTKDADTDEYVSQTSQKQKETPKPQPKEQPKQEQPKEAPKKKISEPLLKECDVLNIKLEKLVPYFKHTSIDELTEQEVAQAIAQKKKALGME